MMQLEKVQKLSTLVGELSGRKSARWLNQNQQARATGTAASQIKRKLYESHTNDDSDDDMRYSRSATKKRRGIKLQDEPLVLPCQWDNCTCTYSNYLQFVNHTFTHLPSSNSMKIKCKWKKCEYTAKDPNIFQMHFSYHSHMTKLKCIGDNHKQRVDLPNCQLAEQEDTIPEREYAFLCVWDNCDTPCLRIQDFINHVKCHVFGEPKIIEQGSKQLLLCGWLGCQSTAATKSSLSTHVKSHLQEKIAACSRCKKTFASLTKLTDHLKRQTCDETEQFQCSHCFKYFATERLLRDHVRLHINQYKCHLCDMTCTTPATLSRHIRYRHINARFFKCDLCEHASVTKSDLRHHMMVHYPNNVFECTDCDFSCRSGAALERHYHKSHDDNNDNDYRRYECHCCSRRFFNGDKLTQHLFKAHNYQWPSGHSRFRYKPDPEDGIYRLQTVRFESIEVTQEIIRGPSTVKQEVMKKEMLPEVNEPASISSSYILPDNLVQTDNDILITICEVDNSGNMIKTETMQSNELCVNSSS